VLKDIYRINIFLNISKNNDYKTTRSMSNVNESDLKSFVKNEIIENAKKIKGKKTPIAEIIDNRLITLPVKSIYDLNERVKHFYLIIVKNNLKHPKFRYFLTISLANNSSDLLVQLARDFALKNDLKLIQYSIYPKTLRTQLLSMKEVKIRRDYNEFIEVLKGFRMNFREQLVIMKNLIENK
jgi:hypothetical protein